MSEQEKAAAELEGQQRLMSFAMGIGRCCKDRGTTYQDLAKEANVREDMLAPSLVNVMIAAAEEAAKQ